MSGPTNEVLLCSLWQRRSERGNEYLSGFLGKARIIGFRGEPTADGTPTWDIYLQPGKEQEERAGARAQQPHQASTASNAPPRPARAQPASRPPQEAFHSDPLDDIGRGGQ